MIKNVKSNFISNIIFSFIDDKRILELVKYNKILQKNININIIDYKLFSGKYIIYEENGIAKEYSLYHTLVFEGKYKNNKRNGKGKEYKKNKVIFEGEYLNGKRNGKGKEYDQWNGNVIFEGEYKDNKKWSGLGYYSRYKYKDKDGVKDRSIPIYELKDGKGIIREYGHYGDLSFEGEYENGELNGKYKEYDDHYRKGETIFEGECKNGKKWIGKGYDVDIGKEPIYEINNGKGIIKSYNGYKQLEYEYELLNGEKNGIYKSYYQCKLVEEIEYKNGKLNGKSKRYDTKKNELTTETEYLYGWTIKTKIYKNGRLEYECEYLLMKRWNEKYYDENGNLLYEIKNGCGKVNYEYKGMKFDGEFIDGEMNGKVKGYKDELIYYDGDLLNGKKNGKGKEYKDDGTLIYEGDFINNEKTGKGKEYNQEGKLIYAGEFLNGKRNGKGKEYNEDGLLKFEGEYSNGIRNGKGNEFDPYTGKVLVEAEYSSWSYNGKVKRYNNKGILIFDGQYLSGEINGNVKEYNDDGKLIYEGEYLEGLKNGKGKLYDEKDNSVYEGDFVNERKHGKGKYFVNGKLIYEGEYFFDRRHGKGKEYNSKGKLVYKGLFSYGYRDEKNNKNCLII